jgi:bacteriocin-like protein
MKQNVTKQNVTYQELNDEQLEQVVGGSLVNINAPAALQFAAAAAGGNATAVNVAIQGGQLVFS